MSMSRACCCSAGMLAPNLAMASFMESCMSLMSSCRLMPKREARTTLLSRLETTLRAMTSSMVLVVSRFAWMQLP